LINEFQGEKSNKKRAVERPGMFADTGIPKLLEEMKTIKLRVKDLR